MLVEIDRQRIRELTEREEKALDERTPGSRAMYERARTTLAGGVASSYQLRDPWPIYLARGRGAQVWDVDGNELRRLPQRVRLDGAGPRAPGDRRGRARAGRRSGRTSPRRPRTASSSRRSSPGASACRSGATRTPAPRRRWTRSGSPAAHTGRDTIVKIFGSYHGHHDYVMVSIGVPYEQDRRPRGLRVAALRRRDPAGRRRHDDPVPFNDAERDGAADRAARRGGAAAGLRDHGAGDDEPRGRPPRAGLPRGRPRDHAQARDRPRSSTR